MDEKVFISGVIEDDGKETVTIEIESHSPFYAARAYNDTIDNIIAQRKTKKEDS